MINKHRFFLLIILLVFSSPVFSAFLRNVPQTVYQPNGAVLQCFASGDEYHNWLHDANNFTIIRHPQSGYYVYAIMQGGSLTASNYIAGQKNPSTLGLQPGINISPQQWRQKRLAVENATPDKTVNAKSGSAKNTGTLNNIVVYIRFSGEAEFTDLSSVYANMFNNNTLGINSMYNYFKEVSYNTLYMPSSFYPIPPSSTVISYQDSYNRNYYKVYNASTNPTGYNGDTERRNREHTLLKNAINAVKSAIPSSLNIDFDNDGYVDNICFIVKGSAEGWSELLWPHRWSLFSQSVSINGKDVWDYNFQLQNSVLTDGVGVLCHEMFHTLGAPDLYHYTSDGISPVGSWDIMGSDQNPPQHMGAFMKHKYGGWIANIPQITTAGTYTLYPQTSSSNNAYKIASPYSTTEYFIVEYRQKTGTFENSLPGSGLLVYRIDTQAGNGNASGPPDEVYLYRPNGTTTTNGTVTSAHFSSNVSRTAINATTNPNPFLSNGNAGGLNISNIGAAGSTISFTVNFSNAPVVDFSASSTQTCQGGLVTMVDQSAQNPTSWTWTISPVTGWVFNTGSTAASQNPTILFVNPGVYSVKLRAANAAGADSLTKTNYITVNASSSLPLSEGFESTTFPPSGWSLQNPDNGITWARTTTSGITGSAASAYMNFFSYNLTGATDELISSPISLINTTSPKLKFNVAYRRYAASYSDGLKVFISTDCGSTWNASPIYDKSGSTLATGADMTAAFTPTLVTDWRLDSVDLSSFVNQSVMLKFQAINGYGNNLYIDGISLTGLAPAATYCLAQGGTCNSSDEYISQVQLGSFTKTSACASYQDFTLTDSINVYKGNTYTLTVTNAHHWTNDSIGCWIDWNQNGVFTDAGEYTLLNYSGTGASGSGIGTGTAQLSIPSNALLGKTRMRVRVAYAATLLPCGNTSYGEVEDYSVIVAQPSPPVIQIGPPMLTFSAPVGSSQILQLTVTNTGQASLVVSGIQLPTGFSASPLNFTVNGGASYPVLVTFSPTAIQTYSGNLVVISNATSGSNVVSLTGTGTAPPQAVISLSPGSLSFSATVGTQQVKQVKVKNTGTSALNVSGVQLPIAYTAVPLSFSVAAGDSQIVNITFSPTAVQSYNGLAQFSSNAASGSGVVTITGNGTAVPAPVISVSPASLSFSANVGSTQSHNVKVKNTGNASLNVSGVQLSTGYSALPLSFVLAAGDSQNVSITFSPTAVQQYNGQAVFNSNSPTGTNTVLLNGTGTAVPQGILTLSPSTLTFGNVNIGSTSNLSLIAANTGTATLTVSNVSLPAGFTIPSFSSFNLAPGASQSLNVVFTPLLAQVYSGNLVLTSSANSATISLSGTGVIPPSPVIALSDSSLSFTAPVGNSQIKSLTVFNTGTAVLNVTGIQLPNGFSATPSNFTVNAGGNQVISVIFSPQNVQTYSGTALIFCNASSGQQSFILNGTGTATPNPYLTVNPAFLAFGPVTTGSSYQLNLTVSNSGNSAANISNISVPSGFTLNGSTSFTIAPGSSQVLQVVFSPVLATAYSGNLLITSNANPVTVPLSGTGVAPSPAVIGLNPSTLAFNTYVQTIQTKQVWVKNSGGSVLNVTSISLPSSFFASPNLFSVPAGDSLSVTISFAPIVVQNYGGVVFFNSNTTGGNSIINVTGVATQPQNLLVSSTDTIDFGDVIITQSATQTVTLSNPGLNAINVTGFTFNGPYSTNFSPQTINSGASAQLSITFSPVQLGGFNGNVIVQSSANNVSIILKGRGVTNPGIADNNAGKGLMIFPNPASDYFTVEGDVKEEMLISLYSSDGRLVQRTAAYAGKPVTVSSLAAGVYIDELSNLNTGQKLGRQKLVISSERR